jgi:hypothetical protein
LFVRRSAGSCGKERDVWVAGRSPTKIPAQAKLERGTLKVGQHLSRTDVKSAQA